MNKQIDEINSLIDSYRTHPGFNPGEVNDGHHTFNELYEFRKMYNAVLFNEWAKDFNMNLEAIKAGFYSIMHVPVQYDVHKSWRHPNGELCFGGGWFIVCAMLPTGQITNHYKADDWELFRIPVAEKVKYKYDGHTGKDVLDRMKNLINLQ